MNNSPKDIDEYGWQEIIGSESIPERIYVQAICSLSVFLGGKGLLNHTGLEVLKLWQVPYLSVCLKLQFSGWPGVLSRICTASSTLKQMETQERNQLAALLMSLNQDLAGQLRY